MILSSGAKKTYNNNPSNYTEKSIKKARAGFTMSLIGLILSSLGCITLILAIIYGEELGLDKYSNQSLKFNDWDLIKNCTFD